jgi:hypothetical protein
VAAAQVWTVIALLTAARLAIFADVRRDLERHVARDHRPSA